MPGVIPFHVRVVPAKWRARVSIPDIPAYCAQFQHYSEHTNIAVITHRIASRTDYLLFKLGEGRHGDRFPYYEFEGTFAPGGRGPVTRKVNLRSGKVCLVALCLLIVVPINNRPCAWTWVDISSEGLSQGNYDGNHLLTDFPYRELLLHTTQTHVDIHSGKRTQPLA